MLLLVLAAVVLERLPCETGLEAPFAVALAKSGRRSSSPSPPRLLERDDAARLRGPRDGVEKLRLLALALWGGRNACHGDRRSCIRKRGKGTQTGAHTPRCAGEVHEIRRYAGLVASADRMLGRGENNYW